MKASVRRSSSNVLRAECGKCGRFLAEIYANTNIITRCPKCGLDNSIKVVYSNTSGFSVRSKKETREKAESENE
jgi:phage FluMu protein Com